LKTILLFLVFFIFTSYLNPQDNVSFRFNSGFLTKPFFYENSNQYLISFEGFFMGGIKYKNFTFGLEIQERYFSFTNADISKFKGAWNILNGFFDFYYKPIRYFELKSGIGGGWFKSAINYNSLGVISKNEGGLSFLLDFIFYMPFKYINFEINNKFDIFFNPVFASPYYYGAIRTNFKPFFEWINLYIDIGIMNWFYKNDQSELNTAMFVWSTGVSFDVDFSNYVKDKKIVKKIDKKEDIVKIDKKDDSTRDIVKIDKKNDSTKDDNTKDIVKIDKKDTTSDVTENKIIQKKEDTELLEYQQKISKDFVSAKKGETLLINGIFFDNDSITSKKSLAIIQSISKILNSNKNLIIAIGGYSIYFGDPTKEIEFAKKQAMTIKNILISRGINKDQIKILASGRVYQRETPLEKRFIEIKIISK